MMILGTLDADPGLLFLLVPITILGEQEECVFDTTWSYPSVQWSAGYFVLTLLTRWFSNSCILDFCFVCLTRVMANRTKENRQIAMPTITPVGNFVVVKCDWKSEWLLLLLVPDRVITKTPAANAAIRKNFAKRPFVVLLAIFSA